MVSMHGIGETKLSDVDYRGNEGLIGVIPKMGKLFVFKIVGPDRMQDLTSTSIGVEPCNFVRVGASRGGQSSAAGTRAANTLRRTRRPPRQRRAWPRRRRSPPREARARSSTEQRSGAARSSLLHVNDAPRRRRQDAMCNADGTAQAYDCRSARRPHRRYGGARAGAARPAASAMGPDDKPVFVR